MAITGTDINVTGGWALLTVIVWIAVMAIGVGGILLLAYWVLDYTLRRTLATFKMLDLFKQFIMDYYKTKPR